MKRELDEKLCRDFPKLYADRRGDPRATLMCFGFECGDGWEPLLRKLSEKLEAVNNNIDRQEYWIRAVQVKEKYGTLRFYTNYVPDEIEGAINDAELESEFTCENCGAEGETRGTGWLATLCDKCWKEQRKS